MRPALALAVVALLATACEAPPVADEAPGPEPGTEPGPAPDRTGIGAERPPEARRMVEIEGMAEELRVVLYESPAGFPLPFSTYVPDALLPEAVGDWPGEGVAFVAHFGGHRNEAAAVRILVAPEGMSEDEMMERLHELVRAMRADLAPAPEPLFEWSRQEFVLEPRPRWMDGVAGIGAVGERQGRLYAVLAHHPPEYGDGFAPRAGLILDEWRWAE